MKDDDDEQRAELTEIMNDGAPRLPDGSLDPNADAAALNKLDFIQQIRDEAASQAPVEIGITEAEKDQLIREERAFLRNIQRAIDEQLTPQSVYITKAYLAADGDGYVFEFTDPGSRFFQVTLDVGDALLLSDDNLGRSIVSKVCDDALLARKRYYERAGLA